jgi:hypothetical protein
LAWGDPEFGRELRITKEDSLVWFRAEHSLKNFSQDGQELDFAAVFPEVARPDGYQVAVRIDQQALSGPAALYKVVVVPNQES